MKDKSILSQFLKIGSAVAVIINISLSFLTGAFTLSEGYNIFNPYADTEFAIDFTPDKFQQVKSGMNMKKIFKLSGKPMNINYDSTRALIVHSYTLDGYLRRNPDRSLSLCGDLAWYCSSVEYNIDSIAVNVYSGWHYD